MKKWFLALLTTLMALMLSVASAENVPLASETEINPVLEAQTLVGLKIPVEAFKETTKRRGNFCGNHDFGNRRRGAVCQCVRLHLPCR